MGHPGIFSLISMLDCHLQLEPSDHQKTSLTSESKKGKFRSDGIVCANVEKCHVLAKQNRLLEDRHTLVTGTEGRQQDWPLRIHCCLFFRVVSIKELGATRCPQLLSLVPSRYKPINAGYLDAMSLVYLQQGEELYLCMRMAAVKFLLNISCV